MAAVVAEFDHKYPDPPEAVNNTEPPWQKVVGPSGVITAVGSELTVMTVLSESVQPLELVTVTVYVPLEFTLMPAVEAELDHKYPDPPEEVSTTEPP